MSAVILAGTVALSVGQAAESNAGLNLELAYIQALTDARMPDYAELVLKDVVVKYPEARAQFKKIKLEQVLQQGKFDEAKSIIAQEPNPESPEVWVMTLTMADYYYGHGKYNDALSIYKGFFDKYKAAPPATIATFYADSYYKFAQMLLFLNMNQAALAAYDDLLKLKLDANMKRQVQFEGAELTVKLAEVAKTPAERDALLAKAKKSVEDIMWVQDLWFGRGVVLMAHIEVLKGNIPGAKKLVSQYMPQLKNIDGQLKQQSQETGEDLSRLSPIAECRYLMGVMMQDEASKILKDPAPDLNKATELLSSALNDLVNVYVKYPSTAWAPEALIKSEQVQTDLKEKCGIRDIKINITEEQRKAISEKQFANARMLFNQQQFEKAIEAYNIVLNQFPENIPDSVNALGELVRAYIQNGDTQQAEDKQYSDLCAQTVIGHLAERFCKSGPIGMTRAGDELRMIAEFYGERNQLAEKDATYQRFFQLYPEHTLAAPMLMTFAEKLYKEDNFTSAAPYYRTLMDVYVKSPISYDAMMRLADCYSKLNDATNELAVRKAYVERVEKREKPGQDLIVGRYMLARLYRSNAITHLRAANQKVDEARRAGAVPTTTPAPAATPAPAPAVANTPAPATPAADPLEAAMQEVKKANQELAESINEFGRIIKLLVPEARAKYEDSPAQKEKNDSILQGCYFEYAYALSSLTQPADRVQGFKEMSIKTYETLLQLFPKTEMAPAVLMQMGTLLSTLKTNDAKVQEANMKKADEVFSRLGKEYPESDQAKNAYFLRGRTLIELGFRREGVEVLKKMFSDSGKYTAGQMLSAATELVKSQESDLAREGFTLAISLAKGDASIIVPAQLGLAEILVTEKKYTEATDALDKFIKENPKSFKVVDANALLCQASSQAAFDEPNRDNRIKLFNRAIAAIRAVRQYKTGAKDLASAEIEIGKILETKIDVEKKFKNDELVIRYRGEAASHYQKFIMSADRMNADVLPYLETAYRQAVKLMLEMKVYADGSAVYADVKSDCEEYLSLFPNGRYLTDIKACLTEAEVSLATTKK